MNKAWVCGGEYDGAERPDSGCGVFWDSTIVHSFVPTQPHSPWPACAAALPFVALRFYDVCKKLYTLTAKTVRCTLVPGTNVLVTALVGSDAHGAAQAASGRAEAAVSMPGK